MTPDPVPCHFVPPYLLEHVAAHHDDRALASCCQDSLGLDEEIRARRRAGRARTAGEAPFGIHDAQQRTDLPGVLVRAAGAAPVGDPAVDEAYVGVEASLALFSEVFGRDSYDDQGAPVVASVHYGRDYENAFWDGSQLVFGDGDGRVFDRFTKPVDVLAHELTHAVTQYTADLEYSGQSGALNESMSDVFAACVKQRLLGQTAAEADWLIGEGLFLPGVQGRALRSMAAPGTAYDDPAIGRDPQVGSMAEYVETTEDNGGVHLNSGIPNRAFHLAAVAIGGASWEVAGRIWYAALTSGIGARTDFGGFAAATLAAAAAVSPGARQAVAAAWDGVGLGAEATGGTPVPAAPADRVALTRTGGFAGLRQQAEVRLAEDPRGPDVERLLQRIDLHGLAPSRPQPDRYVYTVRVGEDEVEVAEQDLTPELEELVRLLLPPR